VSEPIKVVDLVMVVRWPHDCINPNGVLGTPFRVTAIRARQKFCNRCGRPIPTNSDLCAIGFDRNAGIPLDWLKRIPPDGELDDVKEREELHA
jgi:hypothetical protein